MHGRGSKGGNRWSTKIRGAMNDKVHNITQWRGTLKYNSGMLGAQFESRSLCIQLLYDEGPQNESWMLSNILLY